MKSLGIKDKEVLFALLCIGFYQFAYIILRNHFPIVEETHFFAVFLSGNLSEADPSRQIYSFLRTPIYYLLFFIYSYPFIYGILSYVMEMILPMLLFLLAYNYVGRTLPAMLAVLMFAPFTLKIISRMAVDVSSISAGPLMSWGSVALSVRMIFGCLLVAVIYFFLNKRYYLLCLVTVLMFYCHPNSGVLAGGILILALGFMVAKKQLSIKIPMLVLCSCIIGLLPVLYSLFNLSVPDSKLANDLWYANMIRDEADDFSVLYRLSYMAKDLVIYACFWVFTTLVYYRLAAKNPLHQTVFLLVFIPQILFVGALLLEYLSVHFGNMSLIQVVISLQIGHKLLHFTFIPGVLIWAVIISNAMVKFKYRQNVRLSLPVISAVILVCIVIVKRGSITEQATYFSQAYQVGHTKQYTNYLKFFGYERESINPSLPTIYKCDFDKVLCYPNVRNIFKIRTLDKGQPPLVVDEAYMTRYNKFSVFEGLINAINENVEPGTGIIIPPYLTTLRDSLINYDLFFQEKHDGNLMMGSKNIAGYFLHRMKALLDTTYVGMPSQDSKLNNSFMRLKYLSIDRSRLANLLSQYPTYNVFVTETGHELDFTILYKDSFYTIYAID